MLTQDDVVDVFKEVLERVPNSQSWIDNAVARHKSRDSLASELRLSDEYMTRFVNGNHAGIIFRVLTQSDAPPKASQTATGLLSDIQTQVAEIRRVQGNYQPIYSLGPEHEDSPRLENLLYDLNQIEKHFNDVRSKGQIRIIDVGCNLGYVTFKLAEKGYTVIGFDTDSRNIKLCHDLAIYSKSSAKFEQMNFVRLSEDGAFDWENIDCVLLLNVVHQIIFTEGLERTKIFLARLAERVDVVFLELARRQDYVSHGKDHLLPEDPAAVLSDCRNCNAELLQSRGRPLYKITRRQACYGPISIPILKTRYSDNIDARFNRKYYHGEGKFLKIFRITPKQEQGSAYREVRGLLRMKGSGLAPEIWDWIATPTLSAVLMEEVGGVPLTAAYKRYCSEDGLVGFLSYYLRIAYKLAEGSLYHNDLSAHNLRVLDDGSLKAIDFEQTDTKSLIDPFAIMLWTIYDILQNDQVSYRRKVYKRLFSSDGINRADKQSYPDFSALEIGSRLSDFIRRAEISPSWFKFVEEEVTGRGTVPPPRGKGSRRYAAVAGSPI